MKSTEHFIALIAAMAFVYLQHKEKSQLARILITGLSGGLGYSISSEIAASLPWLGGATAMALVTAFIYVALDTAGALFSDRQIFREILITKFGGRR